MDDIDGSDQDAAACPYVSADECATARERASAGVAQVMHCCVVHDRQVA